VRIFEIGRCFARSDHGESQPLRIGGLAFGDALPEQWGATSRWVDVFDVKGDLAALVAPCELATATAPHPALHPGRGAAVRVQGQPIGWLGELHPALARQFELPRAPIVFELELAPLCTVPVPAGRAVSRLPRVRRDMAIVVDDDVPAAALQEALDAAKPPHVEVVRLFDVYRGTGIAPGKKSLAILVVMQDTERTLTDPEIDATMAALLQVVVARFQASLRQ
jgi:phenylalanyl-tRNA synthetase beta chain